MEEILEGNEEHVLYTLHHRGSLLGDWVTHWKFYILYSSKVKL